MNEPLDGHFTKLDRGFSNARKCLRCGWEWIRKGSTRGEPVCCPRCRTKKWAIPDPVKKPIDPDMYFAKGESRLGQD